MTSAVEGSDSVFSGTVMNSITESMVTASPDLKGLRLDNFTKSARELRKLTDDGEDDLAHGVLPGGDALLLGLLQAVVHGVAHDVHDGVADAVHDGLIHLGVLAHQGQPGPLAQLLAHIPDDTVHLLEILGFMMMAGFSTNTQVTEFSGRGVGMDVVKKNVADVGGTVSISSEWGKGMTTTLKIPLTMAIMDGMEVSVGGSLFTIPINNIRTSARVSAGDVIRDPARGEMMKFQGNFYPIIRAKELFGLEDGHDNIEEGIVVWLESGECSYCLFVDELLGQQQIVVKPLPTYVNSFDIKSCGITGCSIMGDGSISIILDIANLYSAGQGMF